MSWLAFAPQGRFTLAPQLSGLVALVGSESYRVHSTRTRRQTRDTADLSVLGGTLARHER